MRQRPIPALPKIGQRSWRGWVRRGAFLTLTWWVLVGGAPDSWLIGIPAVVASTWLSHIFWPGPPLSLAGLLRFAPWFVHQSIAGALDVALRALHPDRPLQPGLLKHRVRLPAGGSRVALANTISMLPGTLSADLHDNQLVIHALDTRQDLASTVTDIEARIAAVFGVTLEGLQQGEAKP